MPHTPTTVTITEGLLSAMTREVARYTLSRRSAIIAWCVLAAALTISVAALVIVTTLGEQPSVFMAWGPALCVLVAGVFVFFTVWPIRSTLRANMPVGSTVSAHANDGALSITTRVGSSTMTGAGLRGIRATPNAVLLELPGTSIVGVVPRAVVSDDDLATLRNAMTAAKP